MTFSSRNWRSLNMCKPETGHLRITIHDNVTHLKLCQVINRHDCNSNLPDINGDCERFENGLGSASTWLSKALLIKHTDILYLLVSCTRKNVCWAPRCCQFVWELRKRLNWKLAQESRLCNLKAQDHGNRAWSFAVIVGIGIAPYLVWCSR